MKVAAAEETRRGADRDADRPAREAKRVGRRATSAANVAEDAANRPRQAANGAKTPESGKVRAEDAAMNHTKPLRTYRVVQLAARPFIWLLMRIRAKGFEKIPKKGPVIIAVNHVSWFDPFPVIAMMNRPVSCLAKSYLFESWFGKWFFGRLGGQIKVDRERGGNEAAVLAAIEALEAGRCVGIWPEGTRSWDGNLLRGKTGVARVALATGAPVYPIAVLGTHKFFPKGSKFPRLGTRIEVLVGDPLDFSDLKGRENDRDLTRSVTDRIMLELARLMGQEAHYEDLLRRDVEPGGLPLDSPAPERPAVEAVPAPGSAVPTPAAEAASPSAARRHAKPERHERPVEHRRTH